jgi:hypothetical protein
MTMPAERTRSLRWTREFLEKAAEDSRLDQSLRDRARIILLTYPSMDAIRIRALRNDEWMAPDSISENG